MKVFLISCCVAVCFGLVLTSPSFNEPDISSTINPLANCSACETIYSVLLKEVKWSDVANENAAREQTWNDLKDNVPTDVACAAFGLCPII
uniref:Saposin B-type domain-containing protein n=1 Tax=Panagrellus redivivus TaxID=6233 RepID=A0A7E4W2I7_PANRE